MTLFSAPNYCNETATRSRPLCSLVRFYAGARFHFGLVLVLAKGEAPRVKREPSQSGAARPNRLARKREQGRGQGPRGAFVPCSHSEGPRRGDGRLKLRPCQASARRDIVTLRPLSHEHRRTGPAPRRAFSEQAREVRHGADRQGRGHGHEGRLHRPGLDEHHHQQGRRANPQAQQGPLRDQERHLVRHRHGHQGDRGPAQRDHAQEDGRGRDQAAKDKLDGLVDEVEGKLESQKDALVKTAQDQIQSAADAAKGKIDSSVSSARIRRRRSSTR